jgi:hypothetical protein
VTFYYWTEGIFLLNECQRGYPLRDEDLGLNMSFATVTMVLPSLASYSIAPNDQVHNRHPEGQTIFIRTRAHVIADLGRLCQVKATGRHPGA